MALVETDVRVTTPARILDATFRALQDFGLSRLTDICRWYLWFAVLDDRYCDRREQPAEAARLSQRLAVISQVLDDPGTVTADPVAVAAADLVRRTRQRATHEQQEIDHYLNTLNVE